VSELQMFINFYLQVQRNYTVTLESQTRYISCYCNTTYVETYQQVLPGQQSHCIKKSSYTNNVHYKRSFFHWGDYILYKFQNTAKSKVLWKEDVLTWHGSSVHMMWQWQCQLVLGLLWECQQVD